MRRIALLMLAFIALAMPANAQQKVLYKNTVRLLNVEHDGSVTLRVTGFGRNRKDAKEQAMKNAVYTVLFEGVKDGYKGGNPKPMIEEKDARKKYESYFDRFFVDGGDYQEYVSLDDTRKRSANKNTTKIGKGYEMTIRVLSPQLKSRLRQDNILH